MDDCPQGERETRYSARIQRNQLCSSESLLLGSAGTCSQCSEKRLQASLDPRQTIPNCWGGGQVFLPTGLLSLPSNLESEEQEKKTENEKKKGSGRETNAESTVAPEWLLFGNP